MNFSFFKVRLSLCEKKTKKTTNLCLKKATFIQQAAFYFSQKRVKREQRDLTLPL